MDFLVWRFPLENTTKCLNSKTSHNCHLLITFHNHTTSRLSVSHYKITEYYSKWITRHHTNYVLNESSSVLCVYIFFTSFHYQFIVIIRCLRFTSVYYNTILHCQLILQHSILTTKYSPTMRHFYHPNIYLTIHVR